MTLYLNKPLVSICIPTYNKGEYIKQTLDSLVNQSYEKIEIIVYDNNSTDNTRSIINDYSSSRRMFYYKNQTNIGCYNNCNKCIKKARGEFIAIYHSDDIYDKDIVKKEVNILESSPYIGAVFTLGKIINKDGKLIGENVLPPLLSDKIIFNFQEIFSTLLWHENTFLLFPTFMARRRIFEEVGLFNEKRFNTGSDLEMWLRILRKYKIAILNEKLINRRVSILQGTFSYNYLRTDRADHFLVMDYYLMKSNSLDEQVNGRALRQYEFQKSYDCLIRAINLLVLNKSDIARKLLDESFRFNTSKTLMEDFSIKKTIKVVLIITLRIATKVGLGKLIGIIFKKILYRLK